jgi:membrane-bound lytic murein transglycosylase D
LLHFLSNKKLSLFLVFISLLALLSTLGFLCTSDSLSEGESGGTFRMISLQIPKNLNFAGEEVPLHNPEVQKILHREFVVSNYWHKQIRLFIQRSSFWFPLIEKELKAAGIPDDFKYLAIVESGLYNNRSPKGAAGFWQFIPGTAVSYGLTINTEMDERLHVVKATRAACRYFKEAHKELKSWTLAAASFNSGINGLRNQIEKQKSDNYFDLILKKETSKYLFRALAAKTLMESPRRYGIRVSKNDRLKMPPITTLSVDTPVTHLQNLCDAYGCDLEVLYAFNPWISGFTLNIEGKHRLKVDLPSSKMMRKYNRLIATFGPVFIAPGNVETPSSSMDAKDSLLQVNDTTTPN